MSNSKQNPALKGPPPVREWRTMDPSKDGSPCVIKRRFQYWQTNLQRLTKAEKKLKDYQQRSRQEKEILEDLIAKVENRKRWVQFSAETLRNSVRFARARITPKSNDYQLLMDTCPKCRINTAIDLVGKHSEATHFVSVKLEKKSEVRCMSCYKDEPFKSVEFGVVRRPRGRPNKKFHKELRYYDRVLDAFFCAKKAAAGNSMSNEALKELTELNKKSIANFKFKTARETDDAEQEAMLGLLEAARKFDPAVSNLAKFTTYASFWIRRRAQARKTSHCKPGVAILKGKHKFVASMSHDTENEKQQRADSFHPVAEKVDNAARSDVREAMASLSDLYRQIITDRLIRELTLRDIAGKYDLPVSKVRMIIEKSTNRLTEALADYAS